MVVFGYLFLCILAVLAAFLLGLALHYSHAFLSPHPDKLFDGFRWRDHMLNSSMGSGYQWWADYDEDGWWEFYSLKNAASYIAPLVAGAVIAGIYFWPSRDHVLVTACKAFAKISMQPLFCT